MTMDMNAETTPETPEVEVADRKDLLAQQFEAAERGEDKPLKVDDHDLDSALRSLVEPWTSSSNGRAETLVVDGEPDRVLAALGVGNARLTPLSTDQALSWLAWCGASGGAHGRRRGGALGRFGVWWMLAAIGGFTDEWDELRRRGQLGDECADVAMSTSWFRFDDGTGSSYDLSMVTHDPDENISIALVARDHA